MKDFFFSKCSERDEIFHHGGTESQKKCGFLCGLCVSVVSFFACLNTHFFYRDSIALLPRLAIALKSCFTSRTVWRMKASGFIFDAPSFLTTQ